MWSPAGDGQLATSPPSAVRVRVSFVTIVVGAKVHVSPPSSGHGQPAVTTAMSTCALLGAPPGEIPRKSALYSVYWPAPEVKHWPFGEYSREIGPEIVFADGGNVGLGHETSAALAHVHVPERYCPPNLSTPAPMSTSPK